jgi:hypothetical protein
MFMSAQPVPTEPQPDLQTQDALYYRQILHALIDQAADMAQMVHQQAKAAAETAEPGATPTDCAAAFNGLARTIRRNIALARHIAEPAPVAGPARHHTAARQRIIRAVEDSIQRHATGDAAETLHAEFLERLDGPDLDDALDDRPVAEIIAEICHDLGLDSLPGAHPWKRRTPADIALLCARAARPHLAATPNGHPPGSAPRPYPQDPFRHAEGSRKPDRGRSWGRA